MTNVAIPASGTGDAGKSVATETIGGVEYQLVKLINGTPGSTTPVTSDTSALATSSLQSSGQTLTGAVTEAAPASDTASSGLNGRLQRIAQRLTSLIAVFSIGAGTEAAAVRVTLPTDGTGKVGISTQPLPTLATTGTTSQVNDTASSTTLLSSDATRKGFRIWNDSTSTLYVKYGTTASLTDCTVKLPADGYLEENFYSGRVDGIWSVDASGAARITALT